MFGIFASKKEIAAEAAKNIMNEIEDLKRSLAHDMNRICAEQISAMSSSLAEILERMEGHLLQNLRHERRVQMALKTILENQDKILEVCEDGFRPAMSVSSAEHQDIPPYLEALMSFAENFALTCLASPDTPEFSILYSKLTGLLDCFDLTLISEMDVDFDSEKHEARGSRCAYDCKDGSILEIVRPGFLLRGKVLRCAMVVVNRHDYDSIGDNDSIESNDNIDDNNSVDNYDSVDNNDNIVDYDDYDDGYRYTGSLENVQ